MFRVLVLLLGVCLLGRADALHPPEWPKPTRAAGYMEGMLAPYSDLLARPTMGSMHQLAALANRLLAVGAQDAFTLAFGRIFQALVPDGFKLGSQDVALELALAHFLVASSLLRLHRGLEHAGPRGLRAGGRGRAR